MAAKRSGQLAESRLLADRATGSKPVVQPSAGEVDNFEEAKCGEAVDVARSGFGGGEAAALRGGVEG